jgi:hypothetical protein
MTALRAIGIALVVPFVAIVGGITRTIARLS